MRLQGAGIAAGDGTGEGRGHSNGASVGQGLFHQAPVDGQRTALVEPCRGAEGDDGVEQGHETAGGQDGGGMVGRLGAGRQSNGNSPNRLGEIGEEPDDRVVALEGDRRAAQPRNRALHIGSERDERMEGPDMAARGQRRTEHLRTEQAAGVDHCLSAEEAQGFDNSADRVVGHGEDDQLGFVDDGARFDEGSRGGDKAGEPISVSGVAAGNGGDRPAGPAYGEAECRPNGSGADDADGWSAGRSSTVRMRMGVGVDLIAVAMSPARIGWIIRPSRLAGGVPADLPTVWLTLRTVAPDLHATSLPDHELAVSFDPTSVGNRV